MKRPRSRTDWFWTIFWIAIFWIVMPILYALFLPPIDHTDCIRFVCS